MRYDGGGNLVWDAWANPTLPARSFDYDPNGHIGIVKDAGGVEQARYVYDGDGKRTRRINRQTYGTYVETWQVYGLGGELVAEYAKDAAANSPQKEYGYRGGEMLIVTETAPSFNVRWTVSDHLGTPRIVLDVTGAFANVKRHDYLPFGEDVAPGFRPGGYGYADEGIRQKFTGYERDDETGLDGFRIPVN